MLKKRLSAVLATVMLLGSVPAMPAFAESSEMLDGNYTFIDTCYSPELGVYLAVAKDLQNTNTPAKLFESEDSEVWTHVRDFTNGLNSANKPTRQTVVWWEKEQKFVLYMNNKMFLSENGVDWTDYTVNSQYLAANTSIETNGEVLVMTSGSRVRVLRNLTDDPEMFSLDANSYGKTIGVTPDEPYTYAVTDQWKTWMFDSEGSVKTATPNITAQPYEMTWVEGFNGWIVLNDTPVLRILDRSPVKYTNFSLMQLSDHKANEAKFTAAAANDDDVAVGTDTGQLYIAPNDQSSLTVDTEWYIAQPGGSTEQNTEEIRSITAIDNGNFLAASQTKLYLLMKSEEGWKYYDPTSSSLTLDNTRIEIPVSGSAEIELRPENYNYKGEPAEDYIVSFEPISSLPEGVASESLGTDAAMITVDSSVKGGHEITYRVTTVSGKTKDFTVTIVDEDYIELKGSDEMSIPVAGSDEHIYEYNVAIIGTDGLEMEREVELTAEGIPDGVSFDADSGVFTIDSGANSGTITLTACSTANPENRIKKVIKVSLSAPSRIEITSGEAENFIPDTGTGIFKYEANVYDQANIVIPANVRWSLIPSENMSENVEINPSTGELKVSANATECDFTVTVEAESDDSVSASMDVSLKFTDLRKAKEDLQAAALDASVPLTESLSLPTVGEKFQSTLSWRSSDETIMKADGTLTRPSRQDGEVTLICVSKNNQSSLEAEYKFKVLKAENLFANGDFSQGPNIGWIPEEGTELDVVSDENGNILTVNSGGFYQELTLTNNSSYGIEADVSGTSESKIEIYSEIHGKIAELTADGSKQTLKANVDYKENKSIISDKIYLRSTGGMSVSGFKIYEITLEYSEASEAVNKAAYTKKQSDIDAAKALLDGFYDLPARKELLDKLNAIKPSTSSSSGSGGGGGGGSTSSSGGKVITSPANVSDTPSNNIIPSQKQEDDFADKLDTFLLRFKDVKTHWAREDIEYLGELELIQGDENGSFRPDDTITRAEFAALITRVMGLTETPYENSFFDVLAEDWFSGYVQTVRSNGYMTGYDGLFSPNKPISREEIAKTVVAAYNDKTNTMLEKGRALYFNDIDTISSWAYDYITEAVNMGFVNGMGNDTFAPKNYATRAQAAVMLRRVYDKLNGQEEEAK